MRRQNVPAPTCPSSRPLQPNESELLRPIVSVLYGFTVLHRMLLPLGLSAVDLEARGHKERLLRISLRTKEPLGILNIFCIYMYIYIYTQNIICVRMQPWSNLRPMFCVSQKAFPKNVSLPASGSCLSSPREQREPFQVLIRDISSHSIPKYLYFDRFTHLK